jgi:hypothetical protein
MTSGRRSELMLTSLLAAGLFAVLTPGCSQGPPMEVTSYWGAGERFTDEPSTYEWAPGSQVATGPGRPRDPAVAPLIRKAIDKNLALKGFTEITSGKPGFWVDYRVSRDVRGDPYGGPDVPQMVEGTLVVYLLNPATRRIIWRGTVQGRVNDANPPEVKEQRLDQAVKKVLSQIPSRQGDAWVSPR